MVFHLFSIIRIWPPGLSSPAMISIHRCILENDQWRRIERHPTGRGFALMSEAVEYAETLNRQTWERFDWLQSPQEAFLAFRD